MSAAAVVLAAALATGSLAHVPAYPGGKAMHIAGSIVVTTADPLPKVKTGYTALFRRAGWEPSMPDTVLNGDVPGADKAATEALSRAVTYLSFERRGQVADLFLAPGKDRRNRPITLITILAAGTEASPTRTKAGKQAGSQAGSQAGTQAGKQAGTQAGSQAGSQAGHTLAKPPGGAGPRAGFPQNPQAQNLKGDRSGRP